MEMLLTVEQAAERLQLHRDTVRKQLKRGALRGVKRGRAWRIPESAIMEAAPRPEPTPRAPLYTGSPIFPSGYVAPDDAHQSDADRRARLARLRGSVKGSGPTVDDFLAERGAEAAL